MPNANPAVPANPANPAVINPAVPANPVAPINPAVPVPPAAVLTTTTPLATPTTAASVPAGVAFDSITVQWVETWLGGTSQTWVPKTITFHFPAYVTQAAQPGMGEVGLGSLTGRTGFTKTVVVGGAARATAASEVGKAWAVAAVGAGVGLIGVL